MYKIYIIKPESVLLPDDSLIKRVSIRPDNLRQTDYEDKYDYLTLCYDVFFSNGYVYLSGPPAYGLEKLFQDATFYLDDEDVSSKIEVIMMDRAQRVRIPAKVKPTEMIWENSVFRRRITVTDNENSLFRNKNTIFTLSKNNDLNWIRDWIVFYRDKYQIDSVLLYDNSSQSYNLEEMATFLAKEDLKVDIVLVDWPYKYGPQGSVKDNLPWDSDFCQHGAMENAKEKYLKDANTVFNVDIDELVFIKNKTNFYTKLNEYGIIHIPGIWISAEPRLAHEFNNVKTYQDYICINRNEIFSPYKWAVSPKHIKFECQWTTHKVVSLGNDLRKFVLKISYKDNYYHFKAINTSWKYDRLGSCSDKVKLCKSIDLQEYFSGILSDNFSEKISFFRIKAKVSFRCILKNINEYFRFVKYVVGSNIMK